MKRMILSVLTVFSSMALSQTVLFHSGIEKAELATSMNYQREGQPNLSLTVRLPSISFMGQRGADSELAVPGLIPTQSPGQPELPASGILVAVPNGFDLKLGEVTTTEKRFEGVMVRPAQKRTRSGEPESFAFDAEIYQSRELFPSQWVALEEVGSLNGIRIVRVAVNPVRYQPAEKTVVAATDISATLEFQRTGEPRITTLSPAFADLLAMSTVNGAEVVSQSRVGVESYLVVVADTYRATIKPFLDWKRARGIRTKVVNFSETGGSKESLKTWLQQYYDSTSIKPTYVLFVGNQNTLPAFTESTVNGSAVSDYRYTLLSGGDEIPDVLYGRLIADNAQEVEVQIRRWMEYEKAPKVDPNYAKGITIASKDTNAGRPYDNEYTAQIQTAFKSHTFQAFDDFWQKTGNATPANISSALNQGRSWVTYIGHGSGTSWGSTNGEYENSHIGSLTGTNVLPIIVDVACMNGTWASSSKGFGETWVQHTSGGRDAGAVSYFGASQNTNWHEPAVMAVGAAEAHVQNKLETLGSTLLAGQMHLVAKMGKGKNVISNFQWYNLFGDPSLLIRTVSPKKLTVRIESRDSSHRAALKVRATDDASNGIANMVVALTDGRNELLSVQRTDASGMAYVSPGVAMGKLNLTVTGYNYETYQQQLP